MPHDTLQPDSWAPCPAGELEQLARRQRARQQTRLLARAGAVAALVLVCVTGYFALLARFAPPEAGLSPLSGSGGIACHECGRLLPAYHAHTLDAEQTRQVREHLAHCRKCHDHYLELFPGTAAALRPVSTLRSDNFMVVRSLRDRENGPRSDPATIKDRGRFVRWMRSVETRLGARA